MKKINLASLSMALAMLCACHHNKMDKDKTQPDIYYSLPPASRPANTAVQVRPKSEDTNTPASQVQSKNQRIDQNNSATRNRSIQNSVNQNGQGTQGQGTQGQGTQGQGTQGQGTQGQGTQGQGTQGQGTQGQGTQGQGAQGQGAQGQGAQGTPGSGHIDPLGIPKGVIQKPEEKLEIPKNQIPQAPTDSAENIIEGAPVAVTQPKPKIQAHTDPQLLIPQMSSEDIEQLHPARRTAILRYLKALQEKQAATQPSEKKP